MASKIGVTHWVDGEKTWMLGLSGYITKFRGYFTAILLALPTFGVPFWWPSFIKLFNGPNIPEFIQLKVTTLSFHILIFTLILLTILFTYLRRRVKRSLRIKSELHKLSHEIRDSMCELIRRTQGKKGKITYRDPQHEKKHLLDFSNRMCTIISRYFKTLLNDDSVGCVIRLFQSDSSNVNATKYVTIGRANLNKNRSQTSKPIPRSQGIPHFFLGDTVECQGVLVFDDLEKAAANGAYIIQKNDTLYKDEISKLAVAPINGWNGEKHDLIGLLYITSRTSKILKPKNVDLIKFNADCLAIAYTTILTRLLITGGLQDLLTEDE